MKRRKYEKDSNMKKKWKQCEKKKQEMKKMGPILSLNPILF